MKLSSAFLFFALSASPLFAADSAPKVGGKIMPKGYLLSEEANSPDGKYSVIYANSEEIDPEEAHNYLVSREPFQILAQNIGFSYYDPGNHREMHVEWTKDSSTALVMIGDKWGTIGATLFELKDGKVTKATDLMAAVNAALATNFPKGKVEPYNDNFLFILDAETAWTFSPDGKTLSIDVEGCNSPNLAQTMIWRGKLKGVWDVASAKWIEQTATSEITQREDSE